MKSTLVDSGPLIALFDRDDRHHARVKSFLQAQPARLLTTWPVLTETSALLPRAAGLDFLQYVCRGGVSVQPLDEADLSTMLGLSRKYGDVPMDFADASLVVLAMKTGIDIILSLDRDFEIYKLAHKKSFRNILSSSK